MSTRHGIEHSRSARPLFGRHLLAPRYWPAWLGIGALSLAVLLPQRARDRLGELIGEFNYRFARRRRDTARTNVEYCFPQESPAQHEALVRGHFHAFGRALVDMPRLWWDRHARFGQRECRFRGLDIVRRHVNAGRSVILLNPHTVAVDFGGAALCQHFRMSTMFKPIGHPVADWLVARTRARYGSLFARDDGLRPVIKGLRQGMVFYYMPDEDLGARNSVFAPFFGHEKATLSTLARLARVGDTVVVPMIAFYDTQARRYEIELLPTLQDFPSGDDRADATAMNRALERAIRHRPEAYLWSLRLFRTRPGDERSPYKKWKR